jgi:hypothetical protein
MGVSSTLLYAEHISSIRHDLLEKNRNSMLFNQQQQGLLQTPDSLLPTPPV